MIRIQNIKLKVPHKQEQLTERVKKLLKVPSLDGMTLQIHKRSIDARKKPDIFYIYTVDIVMEHSATKEAQLVKQCKDPSVSLVQKESFHFLATGEKSLEHPPVIIGAGPAGLFCAYFLAKYGYQPLLLERGKDVEERTRDVESFWKNKVLNPESNVQFGEGGAGTFSDGKLNTLVKDKTGRNRAVLEVFVENGAPESILYDAKPHIGTDILVTVVKNMRTKIIAWGGQIRFESKVTNIHSNHGKITGLTINETEKIPCENVILAIGHSARDTFLMLYESGIAMEAKSFAVGLRVEHPQAMIDDNQYGKNHSDMLYAAPYKLTAQTENGRGVYSFCMCPGGYVVNASSEANRLAINGMSYSKRDSGCANSAIIVAVTPDDYPSDGPLSGITFQRELEEKAFALGNGNIPASTYGEFYQKVMQKEHAAGKNDTYFKEFANKTKGDVSEACDLTQIFPPAINQSFVEGMEQFERYITGYSNPKTRLYGVESRTSSPVRITRDDSLQANVTGLYPCGEGAGYAGGITSAAMDGLRIAQQIASIYHN